MSLLKAALLSSLALTVATPPALARDREAAKLYRFQIPAETVSSALLDLALQSQVSLGGEVTQCRGRSVAVYGRLDLSQALNRVLSKSGCQFRLLDSQTVIINRNNTVPIPAQSVKVQPQLAADFSIGELVVTAGRRGELPGRTPQSITALSGRQLGEQGISDLSGLAGQVAGMTVTNLGPGRDKVLLRGMSDGPFTGLTQSTVGLYVDNIPVTYNAADPDLKMVDIDRVEIMRGPQGTLYGGGSVGGVIRIVTRKPDLDEVAGAAAVSASLTQGGNLNTDLELTGNLPVIPGRLAVRGSVYRENASGYVDDIRLGIGAVNHLRREGIRLAARAAIDENWTLSGSGIHQTIRSADTQYYSPALGPFRRARAVREPHDNNFDEISLAIEGQGSWGRVVGSAATLSHHFETRYDASPKLSQFPGGGGTGTLDDAKDIDILVAEIVYASPQDARLRWLLGGFGSTGTTTQDVALERLSPSVGKLYSEARDDKIQEFAVYGEVTYDLTDRLTAVAGARWFTFDFEADSRIVQGAAERRFKASGNASGVSPKLALRYQHNPNLLFYALASQGYRAGGFNTAGLIGQSFDGTGGAPARQFSADQLWNYELGLKATLFENRVRLRMAGFVADWRDIQTDQFLDSGLSYAANVGDGTNTGLELEATWKPASRWTLSTALLVGEPQVTQRNPDFPALSDAGLPGVARASASAAAAYERRVGDNMSLNIHANLIYVGTSNLTFDAGKGSKMGDYFAGRISAGLESERWSLSVFIDNPANSRANTFAFGGPFYIGQEAAVTPLRPRTVGSKLAMKF